MVKVGKERRHSTRLSVNYRVLVHTSDGRSLPGNCTDLCTTGLGLSGVDMRALQQEKKIFITFPEYDRRGNQRFQFRIVRGDAKKLGLRQTMYCRLHGRFIPRFIDLISQAGSNISGELPQISSGILNVLRLVSHIETSFSNSFVAVITALIVAFFTVIPFHATFINQKILAADFTDYFMVVGFFLFSWSVFYSLIHRLVNKFFGSSFDANFFDSFAIYYNDLEKVFIHSSMTEVSLQEQCDRLQNEVTVLMNGLRNSGQQLQHLTEMSGDLIWTTDLQGVLTSGSNAFKDVVGMQPEELKGRTLESLVDEPRRQSFRTMLQKAVAGQKIHQFETLLRHKSGQTVDVSFNAMPVYDEAHKVTGISGTLVTQTEQKRIERSLLDNQKLLVGDSQNKHAFLETSVEMDRVLAQQLAGVTDTTEQAAVEIMTRVQALDARMTDLVEYMTQANTQASDLGQTSRKVIDEDRQAIVDLQSFIADADHRQQEGNKKVVQAMDEVRDLRKLVQLVLDISEQTSVLSLNARIVAAQAGIHGHKFGVVAQEVRKLSGQVRSVAQEIDGGIARASTTVENVLLSQFDSNKMAQEEGMLKKAAAQMAQLGIHYGELLEFNQRTMENVTTWNQLMTEEIMGLLGNIQFQDITRQRLEHAIQSLDKRREYTENLIVRLRDAKNAQSMNLTFSADDLFRNYVMDDQRRAHQQATGRKVDKAPEKEMPLIQLF
ncbi:MAG: PAS domain S-box protein [Magnetococcales bacterium]|nr:PAS domain S-box protein [Magnetococcales bacterium]MBF0114227.1 PAS domain S-box protein [Magnetococcales bacterium]